MTGTDYLRSRALHTFIDRAIREDIGDGDQSSLASIPAGAKSKAQLLVKDEGTLAGIEMALQIFHQFDKSLKFEPFLKDGEIVKTGQVAFHVHGTTRSILGAERIVLNCMQRMSGIATKTREIRSLIQGTRAKLLDTRKTTPNFRIAEKWAVKIGGGVNHRFGLYDMIMLKDNHIDFAGGIENAIVATREYLMKTGKVLKIEIETRNLQEVESVMRTGGVDIIMLDNMMPSEMKDAVRMIRRKYLTEASGGITEQTIHEVAECGVDFISVGALTHSYKSLDLSLKALPS